MNRSVSLNALGFVSPSHSFLCSIDFLLSDVYIALISPDGVGSEFAPLSVSPSLIGDIRHSSSLVVGRNFHDSAVLLVILSFQFALQKLIIFHLVESPRRTNSQNVVSFLLALSLTVVVGSQTSLISINAPSAVSREVLQRNLRNRRNDLSPNWRSISGVLQGVVVT